MNIYDKYVLVMNYYLSVETCKQLKDWGCDIEANAFYGNHNSPSSSSFFQKIIEFKNHSKLNNAINAYDLRDIIYNGEISKRFFMPYNTEGQMKTVTRVLLSYLQENNQEEAEQYLLDNCIFNPSNK